MKLKDNSGFTLIELLAVITIMGVLMMIAIPAINGIIQNVRKNVYVRDAKSFKSEVQKAIMEQTWARVNDPSATYYIHIKNIILPEGLEYIGASCFTVCSLEWTIVIPPNVTYIGSNAFQKSISWDSFNANLTKIVNKTGREFDWRSIIGGSRPATLVSEIAPNYYVDIEITRS